MGEIKKELSELIDKLIHTEEAGDCSVLLEAIDKRVWFIYTSRIEELTS